MIPVTRATLGSDMVEYFMGGVVVVGLCLLARSLKSEDLVAKSSLWVPHGGDELATVVSSRH